MQIDLLKDIVSSVAGKGAVGIVDLLYNKKNVNEFLIAKKLGTTINQTRTILYKLSDDGLVSFIRKKDSKKGGWYTYFWTLNSGKSLVRFRDKLAKNLEDIKLQRDSRKTKVFYYCVNCTIEYSEENALVTDYTCPECGEVLEIKNNQDEVNQLDKEAVRIQNIITELDSEIQSISEKEGKARDRKMKAEEKKKEKEKLEKKKERQKAAKKAKSSKKARK